MPKNMNATMTKQNQTQIEQRNLL